MRTTKRRPKDDFGSKLACLRCQAEPPQYVVNRVRVHMAEVPRFP